MTFRLAQNKDGSYAVFNLSNDSFLCNIPTTNVPPERKKVQVNGRKRKPSDNSIEFSQSRPSPASVKEARRQQKLANDKQVFNNKRLSNTSNNSSPSKSSSDQRLLRSAYTSKGCGAYKPSHKKSSATSNKVNHTIKKLQDKDKVNFKYDAPPSSPEPDEECIDTNPFMRMLNLVPAEQDVNSRETRMKYPMRRISRLPSDANVAFSIYDMVEDLDVCSPLISSSVVPLTNLSINSAQISKTISNYEHYCHTAEAVLLVRSKGLTHQLRNRESILKFSVTYRNPKQDDKKSSHLYSFSVRQRNQQYQRLKSGISYQSDLLLRQCKKLQVRLKRLNQETIKKHMNPKLTNNSSAIENKANVLATPTQSSNSLRILQPVATTVASENQDVTVLLHKRHGSDVSFFFGNETRSNKVHDWLLENCSPEKKNSGSKDLRNRKKQIGTGLASWKVKQTGLKSSIPNWKQDGESQTSITKYFFNNQHPKLPADSNEKLQQEHKRVLNGNVSSYNGNNLLKINRFPLRRKVPKVSVKETGS